MHSDLKDIVSVSMSYFEQSGIAWREDEFRSPKPTWVGSDSDR
jgi:hypothetical protein